MATKIEAKRSTVTGNLMGNIIRDDKVVGYLTETLTGTALVELRIDGAMVKKTMDSWTAGVAYVKNNIRYAA